jgi:mono/diheme cytochrome c family protein
LNRNAGRIHASLVSAALAILLVTPSGGDPSAPGADAALPKRAASLLSLRCLSCHNPVKKAGGLDLSTRSAALSSQAFVPQSADKSRIVRQVASGKMPPDGGRLPDAELDLLRRWIGAGAVYAHEPLTEIKPLLKPLWSFLPVHTLSPPHSRFDSLSTNPIDRFLFAALEKRGLKPSAPAARLALLRRVTVDLTGLPPMPTEVQAFLADTSTNAYEKVVDRLLASPAYGERWGRHWLDVVRYGESHGYEQNHLRPNAWPYRDYVIRAFNQDKPFDRFVTEQLAGDIVGKGDPDIEVATGFLVAGIHDTVGNSTEEGTRQKRSNDLDDIVSTTGAAFLGLTINCAKCHDHKFDPIPTRDYYRLTAVFAGVQHGERPLSPRALSVVEQGEQKRAEQGMDALDRQLDGLQVGVQNRVRGGGRRSRPAVTARRNVEAFAPVAARFVRFTVLATSDGTQPCLDEIRIFGPESDGDLALASRGAKATASSLLPGYEAHQVAHLNDGMEGNAHSWISNEVGGGWAQIELAHAERIDRIVWERDAEGQFQDRLPTSYRIEVSAEGRAWKEVANGSDRLQLNESLRPEALFAAMTAAERVKADMWNGERMALQRRITGLSPIATAYCGRITAPDPTFVLKGGDVMRREERVTPGALSLLTALRPDLGPTDNVAVEQDRLPRIRLTGNRTGSDTPSDSRLLLAKWITDPRNPLTARVCVNRVWEHHFGHGIVDTPSDFGNIGSAPSHPALLDWLASDLTAHGWRLKRLHRLLVTSYTYRQTSASNPVGAAGDADDRLLWRMPLRRMEAEAVRDAVLLTTGKLDSTRGGPGYALFKYEVVNVAIYGALEEQGPETWRRGVYQIPARGIRDELLGSFDCPDSSERTPQRTSTTTALQALSLLNSRFISRQSDLFAARVQNQVGADPKAQVRAAFQLAFGRTPTAGEVRSALPLLNAYGLPTLCRGLLNANEFLYY